MMPARGATAALLALLGAALPGTAAAQSAPPGLRALERAMPPPHAGITLVALPSDEPLAAAPRRPRHALRVRSALAESAMRSVGIDASECAMLLRMHSRAVSGANGTSLVLHPQMHLACRF